MDERDPVMFHATSLVAAPHIQRKGLPKEAPWGTSTLAAYHARLLEDAGHRPIILSMPLSALKTFNPIPDWEALHNPPLETVNRSVEALVQAWAKTSADWKASLDLVGSFCLSQDIPVQIIKQHCESIDRWADQARQRNVEQLKRKKSKLKSRRR